MNNLLFSILMFFGISVFSQTGADSIRIKDLKSQLPKSSGTNKVDLLNEIAWEYGWANLKDKSLAYDLKPCIYNIVIMSTQISTI